LNGADILVARLYAHGVRTIFGMPGSHSTALYDAIQRHGQIRTILVRNEQAGAFMADGYARVSGRPGVLCTTAGPGATNALTGVAEAWADSMPFLLLAGQVNHDRIHEECGNYHEIDLESIFKPCTKYCGTVMDNGQIAGMVDRAFAALATGRPRPAAIFLPQDLMAQTVGRVGDRSEAIATTIGNQQGPSQAVPLAECNKAVELLLHCERPIVIAGGGAVSANAGPELHRLVQRLGCPLITTQNGKGIIDERDRHSLGHARTLAGLAALENADGMLAVGCRFTEVMTGFRTLKVPRRLVQIDVDPAQIGMNYPVEIGIVHDARAALQAIIAHLPEGRTSGWSGLWDALGPAHVETEWMIDILRAELPDNAALFTDASEVAYRMHADFPAYHPRTFFYPSNYIALGWGFPAALGAAAALPDRPIVSFSGDGGFVMTAQELATAVRYNLHVIAIIHNDATYGAIKNLQKNRHGGRFLDTDLNNPDFVRLGEAFGVPAVRVADRDSFASALRQALGRHGPALIEITDEWRNHRRPK
jgi:acetolactate synthase-1/2/3 large subunit